MIYLFSCHVLLQKTWLNEFHAKCREVTGEALKAQGKVETYNWLLKETQPIC